MLTVGFRPNKKLVGQTDHSVNHLPVVGRVVAVVGRVGTCVLQFLPVQHSSSHWSKVHPCSSLRKPPIAAQAAFLSEKNQIKNHVN